MFAYLRLLLMESNPNLRKKKYMLYKLATAKDARAMWELGILSKNTGDINWAKKWFFEVGRIDAKYLPSSLVNLGSIQYRSGKVDQALDYYHKAADLGSAIAEWNIAYIYENQGHIDVAIGWYESAAKRGHEAARSRFTKLADRPTPNRILTPADAEHNARNWMFYWGHRDAKTSKASGDAGIDVESSTAVAQVKFEQTKTGRPHVQKLFGAAAPTKKHPIFFSFAGYSKQAIDYCQEMKISLFQFDEYGVPKAINSYAKNIVQDYK